MSYNVTTDLQTENSNEFSFIDVGIHENVKLTNIRYDVSTNGNKFLAYEFESENGKKLQKTEWEPKDSDPQVKQRKELNQMKRAKHIALKFINEQEFVFNAQDFESFAKTVIKLLDGKYQNKLLRIKVVYNNKGYTDLPNYVPFIETMEIPTEKSRLEIGTIDKVTRDEVTPDPIPKTSNPLEDTVEIPTQANNDVDDLPF